MLGGNRADVGEVDLADDQRDGAGDKGHGKQHDLALLGMHADCDGDKTGSAETASANSA